MRFPFRAQRVEIAEPPNAVGNLVLLASRRTLDIPPERLGRPFDFLPDADLHWAVVQRNHAWNNRFAPEPHLGDVFTDDRNAVDVMSERVNLVARRAIHRNAGLEAAGW